MMTIMMGCFLVLRTLLFVSFCVVVWVLFSVFSIFCITSLVSATPRNHLMMLMAVIMMMMMINEKDNPHNIVRSQGKYMIIDCLPILGYSLTKAIYM